jgi:RNA polymerase sigma-32 factor
LGIKPETVREMEMHLSAQDMSLENYLDDTHSEDKTNQSRLPMMAFSDSRYDPESLVSTHDFSEWSTNALYKALESLDKRSREIIMQRWLNEPKVKLRTLAERYGLSMERIRQLERNAIKTLRTALEE